MVFQDCKAALCPIRTVGDQIYESMREHETISRAEVYERAEEIMVKIGLTDSRRVLDSYPFELSGGMNQRVGICITMMQKPALLLADEPTTALDVSVQAEILTLLKKLNRESGMAIMLISHDLHVVRKLCSRVAVMQRGKLVEDRPMEDIFRNPRHPYTQQLIAAIPGRDRHLF